MKQHYTFEVAELIDNLEELIPHGVKMKYLQKPVKYDFDDNVNPSVLKSWRGIYSELSLDYMQMLLSGKKKTRIV